MQVVCPLNGNIRRTLYTSSCQMFQKAPSRYCSFKTKIISGKTFMGKPGSDKIALTAYRFTVILKEIEEILNRKPHFLCSEYSPSFHYFFPYSNFGKH